MLKTKDCDRVYKQRHLVETECKSYVLLRKVLWYSQNKRVQKGKFHTWEGAMAAQREAVMEEDYKAKSKS